MDPDTNLEEQIEIARRMQEGVDADNYEHDQTIEDGQRLAELVIALDKWIKCGGFLPGPWNAFHGIRDKRIS